MKIKSSILISSIAACAIFTSAFAFNGFAVGNVKAQTTAANVANTQQTCKTPKTIVSNTDQLKSALENIAQNTKNSTAKTVSTNTVNTKKTCPKSQTNSSNNQQTNVKSADTNNNLQTVLNKTNCNKTTANNIDYSALLSELNSLFGSNNGISATTPTTCKTANKPTTTTTKPTASTPTTTTTKPSAGTTTASAPVANGDYSAFQKKVVELVNTERAKNGLKPLTMNAELSKTATLKSQDMAKLNYFDHNSPTYGSPFDMMKTYGISYRTAGENIAMGQTTPEQVMQGWMNSPGHRANILNASFTQIGVGVAKNSSGRLYWTQQFIG